MPTNPEDRLAATLADTGARVAFGVPGGGANLDMVGALQRHGQRFVLAHGETAACIMASTYGHLTDSVSAAVVTRGPGVASAANGAAQATLDRQPLVLVSDSVATHEQGRVAHQRLDQRALMSTVCKLSTRLDERSASSAPSWALEWPPGCVHLDQDSTAGESRGDWSDVTTFTATGDAGAVATAVAAAEHPVVIVGIGALRSAGAVASALASFGAPTFTTYQAVGVVPTEAPIAGGPFTNGASERPLLERADLIVLVGVDMVEPIPTPWRYAAPVVSIAPEPTVETYAPIAHETVGDVGELANRCLSGVHEWAADAGAVHREGVRARLRIGQSDGLGPIVLVDSVASWAADLPAVTVTVDAGAHFLAIMPLWPTAASKRLLISNGIATMGYAVPAAIGAALARPGEPVLALVGDGGLGMSLAELETVARLALPITIVVFNDAALSLIRIKQGADHGGDDAVAYRVTDFAAVAEAHGVRGLVVRDRTDLAEALADLDGRSPVLVDARVNPSDYHHLMRVTRG
jgi:acetolactate synthase-1/2/3 large subunit